MNYQVGIKKYNFTREDGELIPYSRLVLAGSVNGEILSLEIKLDKTELMLAKLILEQSEKNEAFMRKANNDELEDFLNYNKEGSDSSNFKLEN